MISIFIKNIFYKGQKNWFYAKFLSAKNLIIIFFSLNALLYFITYLFFVSDLIKDINIIKQKSSPSASDNLATIDFKSKTTKLISALENPKFLTFKKLSSNDLELILTKALQQIPSLKQHKLIVSKHQNKRAIALIFLEGNWQAFMNFLQKIKAIEFRFYLQNFDIYTDKNRKKIYFKLEFEDLLAKILATQKLNSEHSLDKIYYAQKPRGEDADYLASSPDSYKPKNFTHIKKFLSDFSALNEQFFISENWELANPFASKLSSALTKIQQKQKHKNHLGKTTLSDPIANFEHSLSLSGIISSKNKTQVIIQVADGKFQTLSKGDFINNTQFKLVEISLKKSRAKFFNTKTKKSIILRAN